MLRVAVLGYGGRGSLYSNICKAHSNDFELVAVIDRDKEKLATAKKVLRLTDDKLYDDLDDFYTDNHRLDYMFVCTQDKDHYEHSMRALRAGYNLVLEKPIATSIAECTDIERLATEKGLRVVVCHVLRYAPYYTKIKEIIDSGVLGRLISLEQIENVAYWHQAHSYVRGNWRSKEDSTPMIIAKCCHDLDIAVYLIGSQCKTVSSVGALNYFKRECAPEGATPYCMGGCKVKDKCPYDAEKIYLIPLKKMPKAARRWAWPQDRIVSDGIPTVESVAKAIQDGPYGRCVFMCDNDVVDYQTVTMQFENGVVSTLTMTAFGGGSPRRQTRVRGTLGELECDMEAGEIFMQLYGQKRRRIKAGVRGDGHGGGDTRMIMQLLEGKTGTSISMSMESHIIGFLAEESRLAGGMPINVSEYRNR